MSDVLNTAALPLLIGLKDVARMLGMSYSHIRKFAHGVTPPPDFPPILRVGGRRVVRRAELVDWVESLQAPEADCATLRLPGQAPSTPVSMTTRRRGRPLKSQQSICSRS